MLVQFGASNYFSFKEWFNISFELNGNCPEHISQNEKYARIIGVKGANASGKTNILKSLNFIFEFCNKSFQNDPDDDIEIRSFFNSEEPTEFFIEFTTEKSLYRYELTVNRKNVISEVLYKKNQRYTKIIERHENKLIPQSKKYEEISNVKVRNNCSFISAARQYEIEELKDVFRFFGNSISNISSYAGHIDKLVNLDYISKFYYDNPEFFKFAKEIIINADTGISDIVIFEHVNSAGEKVYYPFFHFNVSGEDKHLPFSVQSSGTKHLFLQLWMYYYTISLGGITILDEFDIKLHPMIAPFLLSYFDKEKNPKNAQLIFTTQNSEVIDYLGKYRTYLVNKESNESYAYRLDEIQGDILRNDRPIYPVYRDGKIGGIPRL